MRKIDALILTALLSIFGVQRLTAGPVSPGRALEIGQRILDAGPATRSGSNTVSIVWDGEFEGSTASAAPAFYVVARDGGGFVIVSGNDNVRPVLAISENGRFETKDMPEHVRWWMERLKDHVRSAFVPNPVIRQQWESLLETRASDVNDDDVSVPEGCMHHTPEWSQSYIWIWNANQWEKQNVFNKFCPKVGNEYTYTGCVATALAEVLTTLSGLCPAADIPAKGTGTVKDYTIQGASVTNGYELNTYYNWEGLRSLVNEDAIADAYLSGETDLLDNMAHLLADCGAIVEADYDLDGTSAYSTKIPFCMSQHLYTNKAASHEDVSSYTTGKWKRKLKDELQLRPVIYSGLDSNGAGHSFVLDGYGFYQNEDMYYVNFGWSGMDNGYYYIDHLGEYSNRCSAVFDFFPDASVHNQTTYPADIRYYPASNTTGITVMGNTPLQPNTYFNVKVGPYYNAGQTDYTGKLVVQFQDKDGNLRSSTEVKDFSSSPLLSSTTSVPYTSNQLYYWRFNFNFGDKLVVYYSDGETWKPVSVPDNGTVIGALSFTPAAFIKKEASYSVGDIFKCQLTNYNGMYAGTVWTFTLQNGVSSTPVSVLQSEGEYVFPQAGKYKIDAAIAPTEGADVVEHVVTYITVE